MFINFEKYSFHIGIVGMILGLIGVMIDAGSLPQKLLFLMGASLLSMSAYLDKQKMFLVLQVIIIIGTILSFTEISAMYRYSILLGGSVIGAVYLIGTKFHNIDKYWPIGGIGLSVLAFGFATNAIAFPTIFYTLLLIGGLTIATYSAIGYFHLKVKIALLFLILNIIFSVRPTLYLIGLV